jgi:small subunit ribosomal protein S20
MAHHQSARKAIRKTARQTVVNRMRISRIRTFVRKFEEAVPVASAHAKPEVHKEAAMAAFREAQAELMRGVSRGVLHRNTAARKVSRLAARLRKAV